MAVGGPNTGFKIIADRILTWGNQGTGNLGLGYMSDIIAVPWIAGTPTNNFAQMSISGDTTLAIGKDKNIYASGVNSSYQFGISSANTNSFIQVTTDGSWKFITSGRYSSLAVKTNGTLWATGTNSSGNLGLGDTTNRSSWTQVGSLSDWSVVYTDPVNNYASYALKTDGTLWGWGYNYFGGSSSSPVLIGGTDTWNSLSYNGWAVHAVRSDGTLWATGANSNYQIGNGSNIDVGSPLVQIGTDTNWARVYAASFSTAAIKNDGTLWVWGYNGNGNLGLGNTTDVSTPVQQGSGTNWYSACGGSADGGNMMFLKTDGTLWGSGNNSNGNLGLNYVTKISSPVQIGSLTTWKEIHTYYVTSGGIATYTEDLGDRYVSKDYLLDNYANLVPGLSSPGLYSWGYNGWGNLGDGSLNNRSSPVQVGSLTNWKQISSGPSHAASIKNDGTLWTVGGKIGRAHV